MDKTALSKRLKISFLAVALTALTAGCIDPGYQNTRSRSVYRATSPSTSYYYVQPRSSLQHHQGHESQDLNAHQRQELRRYGNSHGLQHHQQRERQNLQHHQGHEYYGR